MDRTLPIFNWSIKKALDTEPDSFIKARIKIIYAIALFSLLKCLIVIGISASNGQWLQMYRGLIAFFLYIVLLKVMLSFPSRLKQLVHVMLMAGTAIVWTNILVYSHNINLVTLQFVFMIIMSSFYTLGSTLGFIYSVVNALPVILFFVFKGNVNTYFINTPQVLASPGPEIIVTLNFATIIVAHYLFYEAFHTKIKEKKKLNTQLQVAVVEAHKLAEAKTNFLSIMSHELRTPLNSVIGMSELLIRNNTDKGQDENLKILQSSSMDLLSLINNVLDLNKTDADKMLLESVPFNLAELIKDKCSVLRVKMNNKQLNFILDIDKQLENTIVLSDPVRLSQVIYNLVNNAVKFTETGTITMKLTSENITENSADVLFSVTDTGIGIHPDKHQSIFELFTQAESNTTRSYGGTGLGLHIVKQILGLFNSTIELESSPGKGSRFFFTISFATTEEVVQTGTTTATDKTDFSHLKILIADDDTVNRILLKKQFAKLNLEPVIVADGQQAYDACVSENFDAIFLDLHMPHLNGYETIQKIRALADPAKANVYAVAFTASINEQEKILNAGFNDSLYKPANISDLQNKMEKIAAMK